MSTPAATTLPAGLAPEAASVITSRANKALLIGCAGIIVVILGMIFADARAVATTWLVGLMYWTAMSLGAMILVMIHHLCDAEWSVVIRRQWEHGLASFKWLLVLFLPLLVGSWIAPHDLVWPWMNLEHTIFFHPGMTVGTDPVYWKKAGLLNLKTFTVLTIGFYALWIWLAARLRKASFAQDLDGAAKWTTMNRITSAFGIFIVAITLTWGIISWIKSLSYHWFSTMFGVWFFANAMLAGLAIGIVMTAWLYKRGDYQGLLGKWHLHAHGQMMLAFTVFWGYINFSQYFLIWNANVPEETFWFNMREHGDWWWVGMSMVFLNFLLPFLWLLSYRYKVTLRLIRRIAIYILVMCLTDMCFNILPSLLDDKGFPRPFFSLNLLWLAAAIVGIGGVCVWAYLRSFATAKLIPIRDPRITDCLSHVHE